MCWQWSKVLAVVIMIIAIVLATGCSGLRVEDYALPTLIPTVTPEPTATPVPEITLAAVRGVLVDILGDVYLRDDSDETRGVLRAGATVLAECSGTWCEVLAGQHTGLRFWRGCGSDNPEGLGCASRLE